MTEAGDPVDVVRHTVGRMRPTREVKIVDEHGAPCPTRTTGEVELRGCVLDDDRMHFVGRLEEMVEIKGGNVAPAEVEDVVATHPDVAVVHLVGADDGAGSERLRARAEALG